MYFSSRDLYYCACTICIRSTKYIGQWHWQKSLSDESCTCQFGAKSKFWTEKEKEARCWLDVNVSAQHTCWVFPQKYR